MNGYSRELLALFFEESEENLTTLEQQLVTLETSPDDAEVVNTIFRCAHTLKGNAASLGFSAPARLAHEMEDLLDRARVREVIVAREFVSLLYRSTDAMRTLLHRAMSGDDDPLDPATEEMIAELSVYGTAVSGVTETNAEPRSE